MAKQADSMVPQIRFKGFSDEWREEALGENYSKIRNAFVGTATPYYTDNGYFYLQSNNVKNGEINRNTAVFINEEFYLKQKDNWLRTNDIVMVQSGHVGHTAVIPEALDNSAAHALIIISRPKRESCSYYLNFYFQGVRAKRGIGNITTGNTIKHILASDIKEFKVFSPAHKEQTKIGTYFKELNQMLALHQRKHDKLITLKQAMLQKMFPQNGATTPEIRFKGFSDSWEEDDFGNRVTFFSGLTYSPSDVVNAGGTLVLRSSNVKNGEIINADNVYVNSVAVNSQNVEKGDIIVVVRNGSRALIGKHAQVKIKMPNTVIGAFMTGIRHETPSFINALLDSSKFTKEIEKNMGATINQITTGSFKVMRFAFPAPEEQKVIGSYFYKLDILISKHATQLEKLKQIKSACLEKMFV